MTYNTLQVAKATAEFYVEAAAEIENMRDKARCLARARRLSSQPLPISAQDNLEEVATSLNNALKSLDSALGTAVRAQRRFEQEAS